MGNGFKTISLPLKLHSRAQHLSVQPMALVQSLLLVRPCGYCTSRPPLFFVVLGALWRKCLRRFQRIKYTLPTSSRNIDADAATVAAG